MFLASFRCNIIKKERGYHYAQNERQQKPSQNSTTNDYASQIAEKQESIASLTTEIASIAANIDDFEEQKNTLKEKKTALKKAEKEVDYLWKRRRRRQMLKLLKKQRRPKQRLC